jgi:hypothetical protein
VRDEINTGYDAVSAQERWQKFWEQLSFVLD